MDSCKNMKRLLIILLFLPSLAFGQWSLSGIDTLFFYYHDSLFHLKYTTDPDTLFINNDTLIMGGAGTSDSLYFLRTDEYFTDGWYRNDTVKIDTSGGAGADSCLWEITSGDTIDTKGYHVKLDSSFYAIYNNAGMGNNQLLGSADTASYLFAINSDASQIAGVSVSIDEDMAYAEFTAGTGSQFSLITAKYNYLKIETDSLVIDTLPQSAKRFLMSWDSATGQVFASDFLLLTPTDTEPSPAAEGQVYYDLSEHRIKVYNGTAWKAIKWTDD